MAVEEINLNLVIMMISVILSFVAGWGLSVLRDIQKRNRAVSQSTKSMIAELEDIQMILEDTKEPFIIIDKTNPERITFNFTYTVMPIAAYESMLYSGVFKELDVITQRYIIRFYEEARHFDKIRDRINEVRTTVSQSVSPNFIKNLEDYNESLSQVLKALKESLNELLDILKHEDE